MSEHCPRLMAVLTSEGRLKASLTSDGTLSANLERASGFSYYGGPYEVAPSFEDQVLPTNNKLMASDVEVKAIYVSRTSNPAGGITVYIGGTE